LIVDIGSNDGTLISNFQKGGHRILGIEPTDVSTIANQRGIPTIQRYFGKDVVYMNSRCGEFTQSLNLYKLLKESGYGTFSSVTVTTDKRTDGSPCETVIVQAVQPIEFTSETILNEVIYDVAYNADIIEATYFGGDNN
ncbi:MAG: hypothetical protein ACXVPQ_05650, partial [Bacteroidia bacterium]